MTVEYHCVEQGNLVVVELPALTMPSEMSALKKNLSALLPPGTAVILTQPGVTLGVLDDVALERLGLMRRGG